MYFNFTSNLDVLNICEVVLSSISWNKITQSITYDINTKLILLQRR
jgi:hypothetical protein